MNSVSNLSFVTQQDLETYGNRLHWNLLLNVPINVLASYLVLKHSTKAMGIYKYYILATIISAFVMDFHSSFIYGFLIFMPQPLIGNISCPSGITKFMGWFWGTFINFGMIHMTMSFCGFTLFYSFIYQFFSLTKDVQIFQKPSTMFAMFFLVIIYPTPVNIMYFFNCKYEIGRNFVINNYPIFVETFDKFSCHMQPHTNLYYIYLIATVCQIFGLYSVALIIGVKLDLKLKQLRHSLSASTLAAHKQYVMALYIQGVVPLVFIIIPLFVLVFLIFFGAADSQDAIQWAFQLFGLHSCGNAVAVIFIIKPYRMTMIRWVRKLSGNKIIRIQPASTSASSTFMSTTNLRSH